MNQIISNPFLQQWIMSEQFTAAEHAIYNTAVTQCISDEQFIVDHTTHRIMFDKLLDYDTSKFNFQTSDGATDFIDSLFNQLSHDTLVITSSNEHESVKKHLSTHSNIQLQNQQLDTLDMSFVDQIDAKKVLVYFASVQITTGFRVSDVFIMQLKQELSRHNIDSIFVLDDVQGMFLYPRNYNMFDIVISTAHALIRGIDFGMCWTINNCTTHLQRIGQTKKCAFTAYLDTVKLFQSRKSKLFMFNLVMRDVFQSYIASGLMTPLQCVPSYFSARLNLNTNVPTSICDTLARYEIRIEQDCNDTHSQTILRIRGQQFLAYPIDLNTGLKLLDCYLESQQL